MWLSSHSASLALVVTAAARAVQLKAMSLAAPSSLRQAREQVIRVITVVAGH